MTDAIFVSDLHLGEKQPLCRTDNFAKAQLSKLQWLVQLSKKHGNAPVLVAGDISDKPVIPTEMLASSIKILRKLKGLYGVAGQHDLPGHSMDNLGRSSLGVLLSADVLTLLTETPVTLPCGAEVVGASWGEDIPDHGDILVAHRFTYMGRSPWPGCPAEARATWLMENTPQQTVLTGDNHVPFIYKADGGQLLVNPGSMMRRRADQAKHKPRVYLWSADTNTAKVAYFPIESGVITREHIDPKQELDERVTEFVARLDREYEAGLSFAENLKRFVRENDKNIESSVKYWIEQVQKHTEALL